MSGKPSNSLIWWVVGTVLVCAWIVYVVVFLPRPGSETLSPPEMEESRVRPGVDYSWKLEDLDGRPFELGRYRGKLLFLNLWATWCGPCVMEMPSINNLATDPRLRGVAFLGVSVDDTAEEVRQFVARNKLKMDVAHAAAPLPEQFQTGSIPATFLIAPDGAILARQIGAAQWDAPKLVRRLIDLAREYAPEAAARPADRADEPAREGVTP